MMDGRILAWMLVLAFSIAVWYAVIVLIAKLLSLIR